MKDSHYNKTPKDTGGCLVILTLIILVVIGVVWGVVA